MKCWNKNKKIILSFKQKKKKKNKNKNLKKIIIKAKIKLINK